MKWLSKALAALPSWDVVAVEEMAGPGVPARRHTYRAVLSAAVALAEELVPGPPLEPGSLTVGILTGNAVEGVVADAACLLAEVRSVPIPLAFARDQARHLLSTAAVCVVDEQGRRRLDEWGGPSAVLPPTCVLVTARMGADRSPDVVLGWADRAARFDEDSLCKIVHTSGTTSTPKGVMLRRGAVDALVEAVGDRIGVEAWQRYVSVVPISLLVEQVLAVYLTFLAGGTVVFLPRGTRPLGTAGSSPDEVRALLPAARPTISLVPPSLVESLAAHLPSGPVSTRALSSALYGREEPMLLLSGGAPVSTEVLRGMWDRGLPVYVAYGLSENGSVATLNGPGTTRLGSVGRPLRHCAVRCAPDGELLVRSSSLLSGYLGSDDPTALPVDEDGWLHTGDIAIIDDDGFVTITGRLKNIIINSNGRNISPEWVEAQYKSMPSIESVAVFGDRMERLTGVFVVRRGSCRTSALEEIRAVNHDVLSEIEQVGRAVLVDSHEAYYSEFYTVTGRPRRVDIWNAVRGHRFPLVEV
jgi:long-chain acyl-CoA synthetase